MYKYTYIGISAQLRENESIDFPERQRLLFPRALIYFFFFFSSLSRVFVCVYVYSLVYDRVLVSGSIVADSL